MIWLELNTSLALEMSLARLAQEGWLLAVRDSH